MVDIVKRIEELMDLFDEGEVTTANKIQRPSDPFREFEERNPRAGGGRIGFDLGGSPSYKVYDKLYKEYVKLIDEGYKKQKLTRANVPSWENFVKSKGYRSGSAVLNYADERGSPAGLLKERKIQLVKDIIERENNKLDGMYPAKGGKGGASSLFQGKIFTNRLGTGGSESIEGIASKLVQETLDKREDKVTKALRVVMNPDYRLKSPVPNEISNLIKGESGVGIKVKDVRKILRTVPEYKNVAEDVAYINKILPKLPKGSDTSMGYLLELSQNNKLGRASVGDWWRLAGDKPEQFAMREALRNWNNQRGQGQFKFYNLNGKEIKWKGKGQTLDTTKILFSYSDPNNLGYKNKLYTLFKPNEKIITNINKNLPNVGISDLKGNIRNLPEFNELVEVVDGRNRLFDTDMINPITGEKAKYKDVFEDVYKNVKTTQTTTKEGYRKIKSLAGHIDHEVGTEILPFNNLRIATGQQNIFFSNLNQIAKTNESIKPYTNALIAEVYPYGSSIDDQIASIINETSELGKVLKQSKGKLTIPTVFETASSRFLQNKIPDLPQEVVSILQPKAEAAEQIFKQTPDLRDINVSNLQRLAVIGCGPEAARRGGRINFKEGKNLTRCALRGINKLQKTDPKNLTLADKANYKAIRQTSQGARLLKNTLGPAALAIEALFAAPFAAFDYASGRRGKDIALSALSLGLADEKLRRDELKEYFPEYGKGQALLDLDERLMELERQQKGTRGQRIRSKGKLNIGLKKFDEAIKELPTEESLLDNLEKSRQAEQDLAKDEAERKKRRISPFDFDPFSAAGGGIAKLAGVDSGPPPPAGPNSQGLQGLMKRVKKL